MWGGVAGDSGDVFVDVVWLCLDCYLIDDTYPETCVSKGDGTRENGRCGKTELIGVYR